MKYCGKKLTVSQSPLKNDRSAEHYLTALENEHSLLSQLLPYHPSIKTNDRLVHGLKEYLLLVVSAEEALKAASKSEFKQFDPLVGENACQIRAVKLALIFKNSPLNSILRLNRIKAIKKKAEALLSKPDLLKTLGQSLEELLHTESLEITFNQSEIFLIKSFLLTKVKISRPNKPETPLVKNEYTDTKKIKEISAVGSMFADDLVKNLRELLSASSVKFVQHMSEDKHAEMISTKFAIEYKGLQCVPCFWATRTLFHHALENQLPIVLIAHQKNKDQDYKVQSKATIYFEATLDGYRETTASAFDPNHPALILIGNSSSGADELLEYAKWKEKLLEICPVELVLAYAASHRQYPDKTQEHLIAHITDEDYEYYKNKADEWGCSIDNPSRFFLAHAYCDKIGNIIS